MRISERGLQFIADFEGFVGKPYNDQVGHCTVGFGHLIHLGNCTGSEPYQEGITHQQALEMLQADAAWFEGSVRRLVTVPLEQHQFDALVSFTFNVGEGGLLKSDLLKKLNAGDYAAVPAELARWNMAGGRVLAGLVRRRRMEGRLFASGLYEEGKVLLNIPWVSQIIGPATYAPGDCGAACIAMPLQGRGLGISVDELSKATGRAPGFTTLLKEELVKVAALFGLTLDYRWQLTWARVRADLEAGSPIIALVHYDSLPLAKRKEKRDGVIAGHYVLIVGMDQSSVTYHDPYFNYDGANITISQAEFGKAWQDAKLDRNQPWSGLAVLAAVPVPAKPTYTKEQIGAAIWHIEELARQRQAAGDPLTHSVLVEVLLPKLYPLRG